jgi:hypothetical protein
MILLIGFGSLDPAIAIALQFYLNRKSVTAWGAVTLSSVNLQRFTENPSEDQRLVLPSEMGRADFAGQTT